MKPKENIRNLPNLLSAYRILMVPVIVWALLTQQRQLFIVLICVNLVSDILDGWIARRFHLSTEFGARLDSLADIGTFLLSICGFWVFESEFVRAQALAFALIFGMYALAQLASLIKFGRPTSLHLYTSKILGYIQGIFIFTFFVFGYWEAYFWFMVVFSLLADLEVLLAVLVLPRNLSNGQSLFHILKKKRHESL